MAKSIVFIDTEAGIGDHKIYDIGAVRTDGASFHSPSLQAFSSFISDADFLCGHNIIHYDLEFLNAAMGKNTTIPAIDTLYLSPLLFPRKPYHSLLKDDKLITEELNNPVNDSKKASKLFYVEVKNLTEQELQKELDHEEDLQTLRDFRPIDDTFMRVLLRGNIPFTHTF